VPKYQGNNYKHHVQLSTLPTIIAGSWSVEEQRGKGSRCKMPFQATERKAEYFKQHVVLTIR
jgi:hypothetical protein